MKINFRRSMDLFAIALITITIGTLAIIALFILICAFQPLVLRFVHRKRPTTPFITTLYRHHERQSDLVDLSRKFSTKDFHKRTYLKIVERSVRTGRAIREEERRSRLSKPVKKFVFHCRSSYSSQDEENGETMTDI